MANFFDQFDAASPEGRPRITVTPGGRAPLDLDPRSRDLAVRTILGEAGREPDDGQAAVAAVMLNRLKSGKYGKSLSDVVLAPNQFEPWSRPDARQRMLSVAPDSPEYQRASAALDRALSGDDPTQGATHFFAPVAQAALGRQAPSWAQGEPTVIGRHNFYAPEGRVAAARPTAAAAAPGGNFFDQFDGPQAAGPASFGERYGAGVPSGQVQELEAGLRRRADETLVQAAGETPLGTFGSAAMNTALMNIPRNVSAGLAALTTDVPFSEAYESLRDVDEAAARLNPKSAVAGTVAGVVAGAAALPGIGGGATMSARALRAAGTGAVYGGVSELLDSKDPVKAAVAAGLGAGLAGIAAPVAEKIVGALANLVRRGKADTRFLNNDGTLTQEAIDAAKSAGIDTDQFQAVLTRAYALKFAERGAAPSTARDVAGAEFGIKLSPGQASGDFTRTKFEQDAARGSYGPFATRTARKFFEEQEEQIGAARAGIQAEVGGAGRAVESVDEAAQAVRAGIRSKATEARAGFKAKYERAFDQPGEFSDIAFRGVGDRIGRALSDSPSPVIVDDVTTPIAARALRDLDGISNLKIQNLADPSGVPDPSKIVAVNLRGVEQARKRLVTFYNAAKAKGDASDIRATQRVIDAFDDEIEQAISTGLFSGSDDALRAIKEARMAYRDYRRTFTPQGSGDDVGQALRKIIERDATAGEVANYLYGASVVGEKGVSSRLALRLKQVFGENSEEWSAVKQGLWMRLTSKPAGMTDFGPQAMSERIFKFLRGPGGDTARAIYGKDELAKMARFAVALKNVVPPKDAVNWSGTAYTLAAVQGTGLGGASLYFGFDPETAIALAGLRVGGKFGRDVLRGRTASKYFRQGAPDMRPQPGVPVGRAAAVGAGLTAPMLEDEVTKAIVGRPYP